MRTAPERARTGARRDPARMLLWHANYHPDGGQLFFPLDRGRTTCRSRCRATTCTPERFVCFRVRRRAAASTSTRTCGTKACSRARGTQRFFDRQGAVHARVSVDFAREFGCLLEATF